ncbi:hypothetical protein F5Y15DRAFT_317685 [Xylariaceae sp. FL0016]|nr:hypothetical protein F5Y15DRAFT_317685 [Xylariaceae sp. FL0016]
MSYPGAPGSSSLPPRPPPGRSGFKPAFSAAAAPPTHTPSPGVRGSPYTAPPPNYSSAPSYGSANTTAAPSQYGAPPTAYGSYGSVSNAGPSYGAQPTYAYPQQGYQPRSQQQPQQQQRSYYGAQVSAGADTYGAPPQIRNPFPAPGQPSRNDDYDPEMAAQIAQWQSAYVKDPKDASAGPATGANAANGRLGANGIPAAAGGYSAAAAEAANRMSEAANAATTDGKKKTVVRQGGGQKWTDDSLLEWDPSHLRLFVGNLAGETTDESLYKAFNRWKSLQKARVIRDKVTSKSKGFGFVSFSDPDEFFAAAKEMNGKYIQSHPVVVRKSTTEIKTQTVRDKHHHNNKWNKNKNKKNRGGSGGGGGREGSFEPSLGPQGGGVTKPGQKTKGGLKLLG